VFSHPTETLPTIFNGFKYPLLNPKPAKELPSLLNVPHALKTYRSSWQLKNQVPLEVRGAAIQR